MGIVKSILIRPIKTFNIENRAHKVLNREKPVLAPTYDSTIKQLELAKKVNPNFLKEHYTKDEALNDRLKEVYVDSFEHQPEKVVGSRPKPLKPSWIEDPDNKWGYLEPKTVREGKCSLSTAVKFLDAHNTDPVTHSAEQIAKEKKLDVKDVANILEFYGVFKYDKPLADEIPDRPDPYTHIAESDEKEEQIRKELEK